MSTLHKKDYNDYIDTSMVEVISWCKQTKILKLKGRETIIIFFSFVLVSFFNIQMCVCGGLVLVFRVVLCAGRMQDMGL